MKYTDRYIKHISSSVCVRGRERERESEGERTRRRRRRRKGGARHPIRVNPPIGVCALIFAP
jgi:hypothetical protein